MTLLSALAWTVALVLDGTPWATAPVFLIGVGLLDVALKPRHMEIPAALNNSFGFGGHNVGLIFTKA